MQLFPKTKNEREISHNTLKKFKLCMLSEKNTMSNSGINVTNYGLKSRRYPF